MLNDTTLRALKPKDRAYKKSDREGLYIYVMPSGGKSWRVKYRFGGKEKTYVIGMYPAISLANARKHLARIKEQLASGIDPNAEKQAEAQAAQDAIQNTFENIALQWFEIKQADKTLKHRQDVTSKLNRFIYPTFRTRNISTITAKEMLVCLRKIESKGIYETCKKTLGICNQIFSFAVGEGKTDINICAELGKQLKSVETEQYAHITDKKAFGELLRKIDDYPHGLLVKIGLQLAPLVFVRPSELIKAPWTEFDLDNALWKIPAKRMKKRKEHLVPLSKQVLSLLQGLHDITGDTPFLFMNWNTGKPITTDGLRQGLRRLGYDKDTMTTHGFRHSASTMLNELGFNRDWVERQLAHIEKNKVRDTYNQAEYLDDRRRMMQEWANYLDGLKAEG